MKMMMLSRRQALVVGLLLVGAIASFQSVADASGPPSPSSSSSSSSSSSQEHLRGGSTKLTSHVHPVQPPTTVNKATAGSSSTHATSTTQTPSPPTTTTNPHQQETTTTTTKVVDNDVVDTLDKFATDITKVLKDLRSQKYDPTVNKMFHSSKRPTFAVTWTHNLWEQHTSRMRFINQFVYWHKSALLKRVIPQLSVLMIWTVIAIIIIDSPYKTPISNIHFPMTSLSLISGFVGSLLALRSNQGLSRLMEARTIFGKVVHYTRDLSSIIANFIMPLQPQVGLMMARHLALFSWLLKNFLRGTKINGTDEDLIRTMLPNVLDADYILHHRKMPVAALNRIRQGLHYCSHHCHDQTGHQHMLTSSEETSIDHPITSMDQGIMMSEKLIASPIPPLFTTHAGRLLVFYLFFLPLALHSSGSLNKIGTFLTVFAVGYAMLGLDEISHLMEQPFKYVPMWDLCKNSMADVADSFCYQPPSLFGEETINHNGISSINSIPKPYWPGIGDGTYPIKSLDK